MAYVSMVQVRIKPEGRDAVEGGVAQLLARRQAWKDGGDLVASQVVRLDAAAGYVLVSVWRDRAAHDRHEDAPEEAEAVRGLVPLLAGRPEETGGEVIAAL